MVVKVPLQQSVWSGISDTTGASLIRHGEGGRISVKETSGSVALKVIVSAPNQSASRVDRRNPIYNAHNQLGVAAICPGQLCIVIVRSFT